MYMISQEIRYKFFIFKPTQVTALSKNFPLITRDKMANKISAKRNMSASPAAVNRSCLLVAATQSYVLLA